MGQVVAVYSDIASAYAVNAKRPDFEAALDDLRAGRIDGIASFRTGTSTALALSRPSSGQRRS
jgi:hypothetical protein